MDYIEYQAGASEESFWFKAKKQLIGILLNKLGNKKGLRILNLGAGTGEDISAIRVFGEIYAVDINPDALKLIPEELVKEKRAWDICRMHYPKGFFDLAVGFDVLEHIRDDGLAIKEISRVLKPGGFFVFTVPAGRALYSSRDRELRHFRRYDMLSIKKLLSGFSCIETGYWSFLLFLPLFFTQSLMKRNKAAGINLYYSLPKVINNILYSLLKMENWLIRHRIFLPRGTTIYGIYQKEFKGII